MGKLSKLSRNKRTDTQKRRLGEQPLQTRQNKRRRLLKHLRAYPADTQSATTLKRLYG
jgi:hypothetical protein